MALLKHLSCIHNALHLRLSYYCNWILIRPENCLELRLLPVPTRGEEACALPPTAIVEVSELRPLKGLASIARRWPLFAPTPQCSTQL